MKKKRMDSLELTIKYLEKEWERSGEAKSGIRVDEDMVIDVLQAITRYAEDAKEKEEAMTEETFEEALQKSHGNFILLRVARKYWKNYNKLKKKGGGTVFIEFDKEEAKVLKKLLSELEQEDVHE